jgi:methionyl aminopeptidase
MTTESRSAAILKTPKELALMRTSGRILAEILEVLRARATPGMTTRELDLIAEDEIRKHKVLPAFKGYRGFTACLCVSINDEIVHGIPGPRVMQDGDVVSIDAGVIYRGYYSDSAITLVLGTSNPEKDRLVNVTREAMMAGIAQARPFGRLGDVSAAVQEVGDAHGMGIIRKYVGHGIGRALHEDPAVPNYGRRGDPPVLRPGMCLAIEPMFTLGSYDTKEMPDHWTVCTVDGSLAAHWEHTIAVTENGPEVLTAL